MIWGGIEAGGTKFVCAVAGDGGKILERVQFPTESPMPTVSRAIEFFQGAGTQHGKLAGVGIASFGPVDLSTGRITSTPKPGWRNFGIADVVREKLGVKVAFDTDVNSAALGEWKWGAARGLDTFIYLTIGTGVGGGGMAGGRLMHGLHHPEMGHIRVPHDGSFAGVCPYHGDCLEGLACGKAMEDRCGQRAETLAADHPVWREEARLLAHGVVNFICTLSPQIVIMGGGVMKHAGLFPAIRSQVAALLNEYVPIPEIVPPALADDAGVLGAIALCL
ncbi:MAG TPA: ROK family protein [Bryobacteraceae bacterium]